MAVAETVREEVTIAVAEATASVTVTPRGEWALEELYFARFLGTQQVPCMHLGSPGEKEPAAVEVILPSEDEETARAATDEWKDQGLEISAGGVEEMTDYLCQRAEWLRPWGSEQATDKGGT